jgi:hypothetical protein
VLALPEISFGSVTAGMVTYGCGFGMRTAYHPDSGLPTCPADYRAKNL